MGLVGWVRVQALLQGCEVELAYAVALVLHRHHRRAQLSSSEPCSSSLSLLSGVEARLSGLSELLGDVPLAADILRHARYGRQQGGTHAAAELGGWRGAHSSIHSYGLSIYAALGGVAVCRCLLAAPPADSSSRPSSSSASSSSPARACLSRPQDQRAVALLAARNARLLSNAQAARLYEEEEEEPLVADAARALGGKKSSSTGGLVTTDLTDWAHTNHHDHTSSMVTSPPLLLTKGPCGCWLASWERGLKQQD